MTDTNMTDLPEDLRRRMKEDFDFLVLCQSKHNMAMYNLLRDSTLQADIDAYRKKAAQPPLDERLKEHAAARVEAARTELKEAIEAQQAVAGVPCQLCGYQHGHAIGCANNPVDIALAEGVKGFHCAREGSCDVTPRCTVQCSACAADGVTEVAPVAEGWLCYGFYYPAEGDTEAPDPVLRMVEPDHRHWAKVERVKCIPAGVTADTGNFTQVDRGALQMALNVLRRAGKNEVADALASGVNAPDGAQQ